MSLSVWLPLNGNIINQGVYRTTFTASNVTNATGKVTQNCYSFNGSNSYVYGNINLTENMTFACWVKFNASGSYHIIDCRAQSGETGYQPMWGGVSDGIQVYSSYGNTGYQWYNSVCGFTTGVWYHLAVIITSTSATLYINGVSKGTQYGTYGYNFGIRQMRLGTRCSGAYWLNGNLNDVRVYDHALSVKEVKELAKGLCCHYKFNFEDLYIPVQYLKSSGTQYINTGIVDTNNTCIELKQYTETNTSPYGTTTGLNYTASGNYQGGYFYYYQHSTIGDPITTRSVQVLKQDNNKCYRDGVLVHTFTATTFTDTQTMFLFARNGNGINDAGTTTIYWCKIYESGVLVRDYIPCIRRYDGVVGMFDTVECKFYTNSGSGTFSYPTVTVDSKAIDCSGYENNATVTNVGATDITILGNGASTFNGNGYVRLAKELLNGAFTVSVWVKTSSTGTQCLFCDRGGTGTGPALFLISGGTVRFDTVNTSCSTSFTFGDSQWHLYTATYDGANRKIYIDGVLKTTAATTSLGSLGGVLAFGGSYASSSSTTPNGNWLNGQVADWRLYSTALSDGDILELYKTKEAIDKNGNLYCNEYNEIGAKIDFSKKSIIKSTILSEGFDKVALQGAYTQLEYLESDGAQYINTGVNFNLNTGWYEVKAQPTTASQNGFILGDWTVSNNYYWLYHYQSGSTIRMYATNSGGSQVNFQTGLPSSNTSVHTYLYKNKTMYVDGIQTASQSSVTFSTPTGNCFLFRASGTSANSYPYRGRIFYTKLWKSGKLVRYFVPVKRNKDNELGMLDLVNNVFYTNSGSGTFTAGPVIKNISSIYSNQLMEVI